MVWGLCSERKAKDVAGSRLATALGRNQRTEGGSLARVSLSLIDPLAQLSRGQEQRQDHTGTIHGGPWRLPESVPVTHDRRHTGF